VGYIEFNNCAKVYLFTCSQFPFQKLLKRVEEAKKPYKPTPVSALLQFKKLKRKKICSTTEMDYYRALGI